MIPKIIHLVFLNKNEIYPDVFKKCILQIKRLHSSWDIRFYNEDNALEIIRSHIPQLLPIYMSYAHTVQRADILRVLLVYLFGGFYLDMDMLCLKPLDELCSNCAVIAEEKTVSVMEAKTLNLKHRLRIANYMFGSRPGYSFWLLFIRHSIEKHSEKIQTENDILENTGPGLMSNLYSKYRKEYGDLLVLSNKDRICMLPDHRQVSCYFGNFAAHLHQGTWRWGGGQISQSIFKEFSSPEQLKCLQIYIDDLLKKNDNRRNGIIIQRNYFENSEFQILFESISNMMNSKVTQRTLIVVGNPTFSKFTNKNTLRILYTVYYEKDRVFGWAKTINANYDLCVVADKTSYRLLLKDGVKIPISMVTLGFPKYARNIYEEIDSPYFTIAIVCFDENICYAETIIRAVQRLSKSAIPEIRIKLHLLDNNSDISTSRRLKVFRGKMSREESISKWYRDVHCVIDLPHGERLSNIHLIGLHFAIPTVIVNDRSFLDTRLRKYYIWHNWNHQNLEPYNANRMVQLIEEFYRNYDYYAKLAAKGSRYIEDRFEIGETQQQMRYIIEKHETS
ncbi:hypothetical protein ABIB40_002902 [Pedobacter sp. UYP30]|uniref:glycosyltransferase family 32 protein n=1 Tax=Pedobacter sp. UYP30 TaxID=1756400 RepID=UPI003392D62B